MDKILADPWFFIDKALHAAVGLVVVLLAVERFIAARRKRRFGEEAVAKNGSLLDYGALADLFARKVREDVTASIETARSDMLDAIGVVSDAVDAVHDAVKAIQPGAAERLALLESFASELETAATKISALRKQTPPEAPPPVSQSVPASTAAEVGSDPVAPSMSVESAVPASAS